MQSLSKENKGKMPSELLAIPSYLHFLSIFSTTIRHVGSSSTTKIWRPMGNELKFEEENGSPFSLPIDERERDLRTESEG